MLWGIMKRLHASHALASFHKIRLYPVDKSRVNEFGYSYEDDGVDSSNAANPSRDVDVATGSGGDVTIRRGDAPAAASGRAETAAVAAAASGKDKVE